MQTVHYSKRKKKKEKTEHSDKVATNDDEILQNPLFSACL